MSLQKTNLLIQMGQIPVTFSGMPWELAAEMIRRMQIVSPTGTNFIYVGDTEPTSNAGPWLKGGNQWYVWDESIKRYVPQDISDSETRWFHIGNSTPSSTPPEVWLRTSRDYSQSNPSYGDPIGWYVFNGATWQAFNDIVLNGPTANRPATPQLYQQYFDSDIGTLIWWERSAWRTVAGVPGDVKFVVWDTLEEAILHNPGWEVVGNSQTSWRGRLISMATKNPGPSPTTTLVTSPGVAQRSAHEIFGETDGVQINPASPVPYPPTIALWCIVKL
jgi:hypothetical protein